MYDKRQLRASIERHLGQRDDQEGDEAAGKASLSFRAQEEREHWSREAMWQV